MVADRAVTQEFLHHWFGIVSHQFLHKPDGIGVVLRQVVKHVNAQFFEGQRGNILGDVLQHGINHRFGARSMFLG